RAALRRLGDGLGAAVLTSLGLRSAWAQSPQSDCERICREFFLDPQHSRGAFGQCVSLCQKCIKNEQRVCRPCSDCDLACCSCFVAGTRVTMADGSMKPIEQIRVGDPVLGPEGEVNRVIGIERPFLGTRKLYALNESGYFVTAEHPFMTGEGWKSIDP